MSTVSIKNQKSILAKLGIEQLNTMQEEAKYAIHSNSEVILLSPTGTGKTLAFMLPTIAELDVNCTEVQALILVPSRELAIQIEQVTREMGTGYKVNALYGGRAMTKDKEDLNHLPAILVGTPGRIADHLRRESFGVVHIKTLILDEFDKSLEVGFEVDMDEIISALTSVEKKILTSATSRIEIPEFVGLQDPTTVDFSDVGIPKIGIKTAISPTKDKLETLGKLLKHIGNQPGIVFCNFKDSIERVSEYLNEQGISHATFHGGLEQNDRENALIKFRNGTHHVLLATDLAARGIDVPEIGFIIHYHLPLKKEEFTHRNGRTARMNAGGTAYLLKWQDEKLPDFIHPDEELVELEESENKLGTQWRTLYISGGRKDKISKGDVAGLFFKQGKLNKDQLGVIELKQDCAFVAVHSSQVEAVIKLTDQTRLKKKKVRVHEI
ncbi:MAG: DEAD/DEAH box helicase [Balneolaceae bacterium]